MSIGGGICFFAKPRAIESAGRDAVRKMRDSGHILLLSKPGGTFNLTGAIWAHEIDIFRS